MKKKIIIAGGGAAGYFAAIKAAETYQEAKVIILEKSSKVLSKVRVSGGGRCNVTHACYQSHELLKHYPRGNKWLRNSFKQFNAADTVKWFETRGVKLKSETDGRMFPVTDSSQTIIDCLEKEIKKYRVQVKMSCGVKGIKLQENGEYSIECTNEEIILADSIIIAIGGQPKATGYTWLQEQEISLMEPVPSLFTFNVPNFDLAGLAGISVPGASIRIVGTKLENSGPLLITHWGFSGPVVLKLSAWGARILHGLDYRFKIHISWQAGHTEEKLREILQGQKAAHPKKVIAANPLLNLPQRLWKALVHRSGINEELRWIDASKKDLNKLLENLFRAEFEVAGKTTFKEEFVTCGGVALSEIDPETMESKKHKGIFFAGEVMDVDGVTGGFNFQSAWSTGFIAGKNALK